MGFFDKLKDMLDSTPAPLKEPGACPTKPNGKEIFYIHESKMSEKNKKQLCERFMVIDTETTGISDDDKIVSIACLLWEGRKPVKEFYTLVNPGIKMPAAATKVNGITDAMLRGAPTEYIAMLNLRNFLGLSFVEGDYIMVAYNSSFDMKKIKAAMDRYKLGGEVRHLDVLKIAKKSLPDLKNHKQVTVSKALGIPTDNAHNALADCYMCGNILNQLM